MIKAFFKKLFSRKKAKNQVDFAFLHDVILFDKLSDKELLRISDFFIYKYFKKGEVIFQENYPHIVLYVVVVGRVKQYKGSPDEEYLISDLLPQNMFGGMALFIETNRLFSAVATEDTTLIAINKTDLMAFIKSNPVTGIKLLWNLGKYLSTDLISELEALKAYEQKK